MKPIYIDVPVKINAAAVTHLRRLYSIGGWDETLHRACRAALTTANPHIDNETITRLGNEIERLGRVSASRSYDPGDVGSRFD